METQGYSLKRLGLLVSQQGTIIDQLATRASIPRNPLCDNMEFYISAGGAPIIEFSPLHTWDDKDVRETVKILEEFSTDSCEWDRGCRAYKNEHGGLLALLRLAGEENRKAVDDLLSDSQQEAAVRGDELP